VDEVARIRDHSFMKHPDFVEATLDNPNNRAILERLPDLGVSDAWLVSGALFQTVWNGLTGRAPTYGIRDYDIFYFDPDTTWDAEDAVIRRAKTLFGDVEIEVRNQARVHIWYAEKFGTPYPPLGKATDGIDRFLMPCAMVGLNAAGDLYAPKGVADIANMIVRPNHMPNFHPERYAEKASRWREAWPEITIIAP
jgi:uncharacterized protein